MRGTIVFDFDYTLADTGAFKIELANAAAACGIPADKFWEPYEGMHGGGRNRDFQLERHLEALNEQFGCEQASVAAQVERVVRGMPDFLFPGAKEMLLRLRAGGFALTLLTHGNLAWQERRVAASGILPCFERVIFAAQEKEKLVEILLALEAPLLFVNDNGLEIDALQPLLPHARMLAIRGPKRAPSDPAVPVFSSIGELYTFLRKEYLQESGNS